MNESEKIRIVSSVLERYRSLLDLGESEPVTGVAKTLLAAVPSGAPAIDLRAATVEACQVLARANVQKDAVLYLRSVFRRRVTAAIDAHREVTSAVEAAVRKDAEDEDRATRYDPTFDLTEMERLENEMDARVLAERERQRNALPAPKLLAVATKFLSTLTRPDFDGPALVRPPPSPTTAPRAARYPPKPRVPSDAEDDDEPPVRGALFDGGLFTIGNVLGKRVELMNEVERDRKAEREAKGR